MPDFVHWLFLHRASMRYQFYFDLQMTLSYYMVRSTGKNLTAEFLKSGFASLHSCQIVSLVRL